MFKMNGLEDLVHRNELDVWTLACYLYLSKLNGWMSVFNMQLYTVSQFPHLLKPVELIDGGSLQLSTEYEMSHFNSFKSPPPFFNVVSQNITSSFLPVFLFCLIIWIICCELDCFKAARSVHVLNLLCYATEERWQFVFSILCLSMIRYE